MIAHVRFAPKADKIAGASARLLCANSGHSHTASSSSARAGSARKRAQIDLAVLCYRYRWTWLVASIVPVMEIESARVLMGFLTYHVGLPVPSL
jgi:hypothetical protein